MCVCVCVGESVFSLLSLACVRERESVCVCVGESVFSLLLLACVRERERVCVCVGESVFSLLLLACVAVLFLQVRLSAMLDTFHAFSLST